MRVDEYVRHDATSLAGLVKRGEVSSDALVECAATAAAALNPQLNAIVSPIDVGATPTAGGLLHGVPILTKSGHGRRGGPAGAGSRLLSPLHVREDDIFCGRLRAAGVAFVGATTAPEFGLYAVTESLLHGPTRNPWDLTRTPGGSSGGSAAAVAAGIVPVATGGDGGGSIRTPAHCTGVFGFKPSRGRTPFEGNYLFNISVNHVLTRSVRDSAAFLDVTQGAYPGARYRIPPPAGPFAAAAATEPGPMRVGFATALPGFARADPECSAAVHGAASVLESIGHDVTESSPSVNWAEFFDAFMCAWTHSLPWAIERAERLAGVRADAETLEPMTLRYMEHGESMTTRDLLEADQVFRRVTRAVDDFFGSFDIWLTPTAVSEAPEVGAFDPAGTEESAHEYSMRVLREYSAFTPLLNVTGHPAASVPIARSSRGLPVGVQIVGPACDDARVLAVSGQLENAMPWRDRIPPIWAGIRPEGGGR